MTRARLTLLKAAAWIACLTPLVRLAWKAFSGGLGANPIEYVTLSTGKSTLVILVVTLAVTPLRRITGLTWVTRFRRLTGLFAFFYGCLHMATYVWLDKFFDFADILKDVAKRPFITAGTLAFLLMVPLALTSTRKAIQRLGRKWQILHRLVYPCAAAAVAHYWWKQKADIREPAIYAAVLASLLLVRLVFQVQRAQKAGAAQAAPEVQGTTQSR